MPDNYVNSLGHYSFFYCLKRKLCRIYISTKTNRNLLLPGSSSMKSICTQIFSRFIPNIPCFCLFFAVFTSMHAKQVLLLTLLKVFYLLYKKCLCMFSSGTPNPNVVLKYVPSLWLETNFAVKSVNYHKKVRHYVPQIHLVFLLLTDVI